MKIKNIQIISLVVGLLLFIYVLSKIDLSKISIHSLNLDFNNIATILLLTLALFIIRTIRWRTILTAANIRLSFIDAHLLAASSMGLSIFTPAQSGDVLKIEFLKSKYGIQRRKSFSTLVLEKIQDLSFLSLASIIFLVYKGKEILQLNYAILITVVILVLIALFVIILTLHRKFEVIKTLLLSFKGLIKRLDILIISFIFTLAYWLVCSWIWVLLARIVNIEITLTMMLLVMSATNLFGVLTLIPGAIGAMEVSSALLIALSTGYPLSRTILVGLMARLEDVLIFIVGYFHLFFIKKTENLNKAKSTLSKQLFE